MTSLEPITDLQTAREEWTALGERSGNVFATWHWADTWWRHFGASGELALWRCSRQGEPFAILPLYISRRGPLRLLRFIGHGVGDVLGPVCDPANANAAVEALTAGLRDGLEGRPDVLLAERLPATAGLDEELGGKLLQTEASPALAIAGQTWDEYLASSSRNLREKLRRNTRKLEREGDLTYRLCEDPDQVEATMDTLFRLHALRWSDGGAFERGPAGPFHKEFAAVAMENGWLRLWTMELDGEPIAAWYGFRFGGTEAYYQSGRDPSYDRFSIGFLMLMQTLKAAFDSDLSNYAFLRGDEAYKGRFATSDTKLETRAVGRGALGKASIGLSSVALEVPWLRRRAIAAVN